MVCYFYLFIIFSEWKGIHHKFYLDLDLRFSFFLFFIYIEIGITDTDIVKERYNSYLHQSSLFYLILFHFVIIESASFGYNSSNAYILIGDKDKAFKEYCNSDGVMISVVVDMNKFLFFLFSFYFIFILFIYI
jgi:hypothetical protein